MKPHLLKKITEDNRYPMRNALSRFFGSDAGLFWALYSSIWPNYQQPMYDSVSYTHLDVYKRQHLGGPFAVVVAVARGLTEVVLPQMHLLVNQRRQNFQVGPTDKGIGVEGNFIAGLIGVAVVEPLGTKVPACGRMAVEGDQTRR